MKKIWVALVAVLWGLAALQAFGISREEEKERLIQVLADVGTMEQSASVEYCGVLKEKEEAPAGLLKKVAKGLGLEEKMTLNQRREKDRRVEELSSRSGEDSLNAKIITMEEGEREAQYFLLSIKVQSDPARAFEWREQLLEILDKAMENVHSTTNIIGSYDGKLSLAERNQAADELLKRMDVTVVEENRSMELYTIYGYTPILTEHQLQKGSPININLAMNYDEIQDRTYIYAAVPILALDY